MEVSPEIIKFRSVLNNAAPSDFDGHTDFDKLTLDQRLFWLSQCAQFVTDVKIENKI